MLDADDASDGEAEKLVLPGGLFLRLKDGEEGIVSLQGAASDPTKGGDVFNQKPALLQRPGLSLGCMRAYGWSNTANLDGIAGSNLKDCRVLAIEMRETRLTEPTAIVREGKLGVEISILSILDRAWSAGIVQQATSVAMVGFSRIGDIVFPIFATVGEVQVRRFGEVERCLDQEAIPGGLVVMGAVEDEFHLAEGVARSLQVVPVRLHVVESAEIVHADIHHAADGCDALGYHPSLGRRAT